MRTLIVDLSYGDTGKGRVSANLIEQGVYDWTVKFNGGANAGHTVVKDKKTYKLHHLTAGAVYGLNVAIDSGAVVDLEILKKELEQFDEKVNLFISSNCHVVQTKHKEEDINGSGVGSTKKGMAYVYADRAKRTGVRITKEDLFEYDIDAVLYQGLPPFKKRDGVIYEGSQGIMLDVDYGCYPFVTSSSVFPGCHHKINNVVGVFKAYTTRVGDGPPNHPDIEWIRNKGKEYGTTTGRPRKCTWNSLSDLDYAMSLANPDLVYVTKMDILFGCEDINVYDLDNNLKKVGGVKEYVDFLSERWDVDMLFSVAPFGPVGDAFAVKVLHG